MAVNLDKYKDALLAAWKDVVDDKSEINWALFSYEGQTNVLKVISTGDGGLEEMVEDFSSGKIMYAFCKVMDPNTSLPKFVLINWQGEAAPLDRKGKCANHVVDVSRFFKGVHVSINARTEDDVDAELIINKVAKSTVSAYNFKARSAPEVDSPKPVGSVYKRIIPTAEINPAERDKFWEKEEAEERVRLEQEKKKANESKKKMEDERKKRELQESQAREEKVRQRMRSISEQREAEKFQAKQVSESENSRWEEQMQEEKQEQEARKIRRESLKNERKQEAEVLIAQRTINARAIFEKNSSAGQFHQSRRLSAQLSQENGYSSNSSIPNDLVHHDYNAESSQASLQRPDVIPDTPPENVALSPNLAKSISKEFTMENEVVRPDEDEPSKVTYQENLLQKEIHVGEVNILPEESMQVAQSNDHNAYVDGGSGDGAPVTHCIRARALYDYQAADETEISFDPDNIITHIEQIDEGWWQGLAPDGQYGLFPANYVELL